MKTSAMVTMAVMLAGRAWAAGKSDSQRLVICMQDGQHAGVADAAAKATRLFLSAGVKLDWHRGPSFCKGRPDAMVVSFPASTPKTFHPGALGYALPYEGVHIRLFYDRIADADPELAPSLMAHVIVHEITHLLQGIDRHSAGGIMKGAWDSYDFTLMKRGQLRFTAEDIDMIHDGYVARTARSAGGAVAAPARSTSGQH